MSFCFIPSIRGGLFSCVSSECTRLGLSNGWRQLNRVSSGSFGIVYTALGPLDPTAFKQPHRHNGTCLRMEQLCIYAVKKLPRTQRCPYEKETLCHQIVAMCPGVVTLHHVVEEPEATYLIMARNINVSDAGGIPFTYFRVYHRITIRREICALHS